MKGSALYDGIALTDIQALDKHLIRISKKLSDARISYWLDSGTLLGICRDGELISSDPDIDIGVLGDQADALVNILDAFRAEGYEVKTYYIFNRLYKVKLIPLVGQYARTVDIAVYRRHHDIVWCPARKWRPNPYKSGSIRYYLFRLLRRIARIPKRRHSDRWPNKKVIELRTWCVPFKYFQSTVVINMEDISLPIPEDWQGYLELRYGDWRKPVESWSYWTDDRCLKPVPPKTLLTI